MRVAVSGTHCCGKSALIEEFLTTHPDFIHEPEPYTALEENYGETFSAEPTPDDFYRQLEFNLDRVRRYKPGERVIYERSPMDFLAYLLALNDLHRDEEARRLADSSLATATDAIQHLDLIVFLPLNDNDEEGIGMSDSEDPELRSAVDCRLAGIFSDDEFNIFTSPSPTILEARGSAAQRLRVLENAVRRQLAEGENG